MPEKKIIKRSGQRLDSVISSCLKGDAELKERSGCPISAALDIFGDKWTLLIIRDLIFNGKNTFMEFLNGDEKIATNILADRLDLLEAAGMISKQVHPEKRSKNLYRLTQKGKDLMPVLMEIIKWSNKYGKFSEEVRRFSRLIEEDRDALMKNISAGLRD